jgi:hypothetical protein
MQILNKHFSYLQKVISYLFTFPCGTSGVERDFSVVSVLKSKLRSRKDTTTLDALLRVRENVSNDIEMFEPTDEMFSLFNQKMYDFKGEKISIEFNN